MTVRTIFATTPCSCGSSTFLGTSGPSLLMEEGIVPHVALEALTDLLPSSLSVLNRSTELVFEFQYGFLSPSEVGLELG
jgi:hypothetical protein